MDLHCVAHLLHCRTYRAAISVVNLSLKATGNSNKGKHRHPAVPGVGGGKRRQRLAVYSGGWVAKVANLSIISFS